MKISNRLRLADIIAFNRYHSPLSPAGRRWVARQRASFAVAFLALGSLLVFVYQFGVNGVNVVMGILMSLTSFFLAPFELRRVIDARD